MFISKFKYSIPVLSVLFLAVLSGCGTNGEKAADDKNLTLADSIAKRLQIDTVKVGRVVNAINLTGKVGFNEDNVVKIYPMVSGIAQDVKVVLGDYVQAGQVLGIIRSSEMAGYSTDLITAETNEKVAKKSLDAAEDMYKSGLMSYKDYLAAQAAYEQAKAIVTKERRILSINGGSTNGTFVIKAPISGFIVEKFLTNNMAIRTDNTSNLFTISDLKNVWITANVYESNIPHIKMGDSVNVTTISYPDKVFQGKVDKLMNVLDPTNKVMKVRIVLSNPGYLLKPEMFANVTIMNQSSGDVKFCIPSSALIFDNSQYYVLVYKNNHDISIRPVQVANTVGPKTYILSGLSVGERLITSDALLIYQQLNA